MKREDHKSLVNELFGMVSPEHQARATEILRNLSDDYEETLTTSEQATANLQTANANFEELRKVNAKLFLQVGQTEKTEGKQEPETDKPEETKILPFEQLFNEKGELL